MGKSKLEYVWLDGYNPTQNMRSKTKIVENFSDGDVIKVNHYLNPNAIQFDLETSKKSIAQSYRNNKKSSKKIGDHIFWWDKNHSC